MVATRLFSGNRRRAALAAVSVLTTLVLGTLSGCGSDERAEENADAEDWGVPSGRWHGSEWMEVPHEVERDLTAAQKAEFKRLLSIGYLSGSSPIPANTGVIVYDASATWDGPNFYTSGHFPGAVLMDMRGNVLHEWKHGFLDAWEAMPGEERPRSIKSGGFWRRAHLFENGDVIAIFDWIGIIKVDKDSSLLWARFAGFHHDLDVLPGGNIVTLVRKAKIVPRIHPELPILEDYIVVLDADGNELRRVSLLEAIERSEHTYLLGKLAESGDIFHTNTVEVLDGSLADRIPGFEAGNVLVTIREIGCIAVVDLEREEVVWSFDGHWKMPHQATVLANGNMMIFDNRGNGGCSQVIEFDPVTRSAPWIYRGKEPKDFHSNECGSNQRLTNGNTLITETDRGKAFEVTPEGKVVWKYLNPMHARENEGEALDYIASVFDMVRLPRDFPLDWLETD